MKKFLGILALVLITAIFFSAVTFFVVSKQYSDRRTRELNTYEQQIDKLEAQIAKREAAKREPPQPISVAVPSPASPRTRYQAATSGSKCRIDGTSSIHEWKMETSIIGGVFEIDGQLILDPNQSTPAGVGADGRVSAAAEVAIPVRALKSYSTKMDEVYQDHMEATTYRKIEYRLKNLVLKKTPRAPNTPFEFDSQGELTVHGVTNLLSMPVKIERLDAATLRISGTTPLKMTAFKVQPPSPLIANVQIKTGDDITVTFQWVMGQTDGGVNVPPKATISEAR